MRRGARIVSIALGVALALVAVAAVAGAISNRSLPRPPQSQEGLTPADAARLAEAMHLKQALGDDIWPGWGTAKIPMIVWNREYSFLVGMPGPVAGWEPTSGRIEGQTVYRRATEDPQNFCVLVGERYAGSMASKWETDARLMEMFADAVPDPLDAVFPFRLLIQPSEVQISGQLHETFHAFQATLAPDRLQAAEAAHGREADYWPLDGEMRPYWQKEIDALADAVGAASDEDAARFAGQFLAARAERRRAVELPSALVNYERLLEWEEGLAKYVEMAAWRAASERARYVPVLTREEDPDFDGYAGYASHWKESVAQMRRQASREGEVRFYYTGLAQAMLLDRFAPRWKERALADGGFVEDWLADALEHAGQTAD